MATWQVPFPSWKAMLLQLAWFFFFEDFFHFLGTCPTRARSTTLR
jgi:methylsterol monooxygenase